MTFANDRSPAFTADDWAEIYYAVDDKRNAIEGGDYGEDERHNVKWVAHLANIVFKLERFFEAHNIAY